MKCLIFRPGQKCGTPAVLNTNQISATVGGAYDICRWGYRNRELMVYTGGKAAESRGEDANRFIDGRAVHGTIVIVVDDLTPFMIKSFCADNLFPRVRVARSG